MVVTEMMLWDADVLTMCALYMLCDRDVSSCARYFSLLLCPQLSLGNSRHSSHMHSPVFLFIYRSYCYRLYKAYSIIWFSTWSKFYYRLYYRNYRQSTTCVL